MTHRAVKTIIKPGKIVSHHWVVIVVRASVRRFPHDGVGGWMPSPRNETAVSVSIATATISVASTTMMPTRFGRMWRTMILKSETPVAFAACTYSWSRSERTCPRTSRAILGQIRNAITRVIVVASKGTKLPKTRSTGRKGRSSMKSVKLIKAASVNLLKYPETIPTAVPTTVTKVPTPRPTSSEIRPPYMTRVSSSRPSWSVPIGLRQARSLVHRGEVLLGEPVRRHEGGQERPNIQQDQDPTSDQGELVPPEALPDDLPLGTPLDVAVILTGSFGGLHGGARV